MKVLIPLCIAVLSVWSYADYVEVKRANGTSTSYSGYSSKLYVCYDKRVKAVIEGDMYLSYRGCRRENVKCARIGKVHFGKYPTDYKAGKALQRCRNARPRFVD